MQYDVLTLQLSICIIIGEDPNGIPNNLMPYVSQVVVGRREKLTIFGNDYPTKDGTGVRDYIHVMDLAEGHLSALRYMENSVGKDSAISSSNSRSKGHGKLSIFNLGTGVGYSVLDMVEAMKKASGRPLPYEFGPRREGDIAVCYADPTVAREELGWTATRGLEAMCQDLWNWQSNNPNGFNSQSK
jgi:UDP-glucose 4-epimerase